MNRAQRRLAARADRRTRARPARKPRPVVPDAVQHAIAAVTPLTTEQQRELGLRTHGAVHAITHGNGTDHDAAMLGSMANVLLVLVERVGAQTAKSNDESQIDVSREAMRIVKAAQAALLAMQARQARHGTWGFTGTELSAVNACIELHDQFLHVAPQGLIEQAVRTAQVRAHQGFVAANTDELDLAS